VLLSVPITQANSAATFTAGLSIIETVAGVVKQLLAGQDFEIDSSSLGGDDGAALIYRLNELGHPRTWPDTKIVVTYQAGYALPNDQYGSNIALLPSDLQSACIRLVVWRQSARGRDPTLRGRQTPNLGTEQYWVGATPGQTGPWPNEIMGVVDNYRVPVTA
jgi:hypothetical protein